MASVEAIVQASPKPASASPTPAPDPTFPAIVAGVASLGEGQDPRSYTFDDLGDLEATADGTLYVSKDRAVWRLTPGQPLQVVAGGHLSASTTFTGRGGRDVGFGRRPGLSMLPDEGDATEDEAP